MKKTNELRYEEIVATAKVISRWYRGKDKNLTIITVPFNSVFVLKKLILDIIKNDGNILYVWGLKEKNDGLIKKMKVFKKDLTSRYINENNIKSEIDFIYNKDIFKVKEKYDLIIFDDISCFSEITKKEACEQIAYAGKISKKKLMLTIEPLELKGEIIDMLSVYDTKPYVEPRIIQTRIDLKKDIPYILFDYIKWFVKNGKKIIIFVPDKEKLNCFYEYYTKKIRLKNVQIIPILKNEDKDIVKDVLKNKNEATIIITDFMEVSLYSSRVGNAIILFSDSREYTYKKILFLCGEMDRINEEIPEVLLVSKGISLDMDKVKDITRDFNKRLWEKKFGK